MPSNRRRFLKRTVLGLAGVAAAPQLRGMDGQSEGQQTPPGTPPAFGTGPSVGPAVTPGTIAEAEKLAQVEYTAAERAQAAGNWSVSLAPVYERRTGPRKVALDPALAPASRWDPALAVSAKGPAQSRFLRSAAAAGALPGRDEDIAFSRLPALSRWIETRALSSERLTRIYLERLERFQPRLNCVITLTRDLALEQARRADREIAAGKYRGPLHGIPWGAKDLVDTAGIATTYGAEPYRNRVPSRDAAVVGRLHDAGAVLVAKLSLGALALNDIWFGGQTNNPWLLEEGSSGSSAGPGAATASGCVAFAIASETGGSIIGPAMRCGVAGLRPTYGRVPRTGAMTLCWSLDKLGPMARGVEDTLFVLQAISGADPGDVASVPSHLDFDAGGSLEGLRIGYFPRWMQEAPATDVDRAAFEAVRRLGLAPVEVELPDWPYSSLNTILFAEAAAAFEELTLGRGLDQLKMQVPDAWPNIFRQSRFLSAVDFVQADRLRRLVSQEMARVFAKVDLLLVPSLRDEMLTISNQTGHPSLTLRAGFVEVGQARSDWAPNPASPLPRFSPPRRVPHGITLIGRLFDEGLLGRVGIALERAFGVADARPPGFSAVKPPDVTARRSAFRQLHESGCFVLPNPWDIGTARYLGHLGFKALATTSSGFSFSRGLPDTGAVTREMALGHIAEIVAASELPVNADFQAGYAHEPDGVAESVGLCVGTGVAGLSIEDSTGERERPLYDLPLAVERVRAARAAIDASGTGVLLTARAECFLVGHPDPLAESIRRLQAYAAAGADVLYAPGVRDPRDIAAIVAAAAPKPVNVLVSTSAGPSVAELAALGVRRVSVGSGLSRAAWTGFIRAAKALAEEGSFAGFDGLVPFAELDRFFLEDSGRRP